VSGGLPRIDQLMARIAAPSICASVKLCRTERSSRAEAQKTGASPSQLNLNRPPMMFLIMSGSEPPVGVVRLTKSNTLPSFMP
jgi:hypothetical protein